MIYMKKIVGWANGEEEENVSLVNKALVMWRNRKKKQAAAEESGSGTTGKGAGNLPDTIKFYGGFLWQTEKEHALFAQMRKANGIAVLAVYSFLMN